jgi:hypothetical protein
VKTLKFAGALVIGFALGGVTTAITSQSILEDARRNIATARNALGYAPAIVAPADDVVRLLFVE